MGNQTKEQRLKNVHEDALSEFDNVQSAMRDERLQCLQDRRFYSIRGAQWEGPLSQQFENKPKFEVNKIHLAVIRIINEYRNNRITVNFVPKDGSKNDKLADTCNGLYRADEQDSGAEEALDNAFEEAVGGGFGAWRLRANYEDENDAENEQQRICIEPIFDADSTVFFNLDAKRQDKADAKRCWVLSAMSPQAYENEYDDDPTSWPKLVQQSEFDWLTPDVVYVAEYYVKEKTKKLWHYFKGLDGQEQKYLDEELAEPLNEDSDETDNEDAQVLTLADKLQATGFKEYKTRRIAQVVVHKYIMSGGKILEDCGEIAGPNIPIVPVYGKRWFIDNVERCMGHVRLPTDAQRLKNMQLSKLGELSAYSGISKPIFTPEQMAGHAVMWAQDTIKNFPYLLANAMLDANGQPMVPGPIGYTKSPEIPQAMAALMQITEQDMQDLLGNQEAGEQLQSNVSGIAVELIQNKLDMQTFIYISNMAKAVKRSGEVWLGMAKAIYVEEGRKMKTVNQAGETSSIELAVPAIEEETGREMLLNDLANANFDVAVEVGPTSASKRAATVRGLLNMKQTTQDPETLTILDAMIMMNMEGEGISDVRNYFRQKLLRMGAVEPTEEEQAEMEKEAAAKAQQPPDAQTQLAQSLADQADADAASKRMNTVLTQAKVDQTHADTVKTLSDVEQSKKSFAMEAWGKMRDFFSGQNNSSGLQ